jgi:hypothetical protein
MRRFVERIRVADGIIRSDGALSRGLGCRAARAKTLRAETGTPWLGNGGTAEPGYHKDNRPGPRFLGLR